MFTSQFLTVSLFSYCCIFLCLKWVLVTLLQLHVFLEKIQGFTPLPACLCLVCIAMIVWTSHSGSQRSNPFHWTCCGSLLFIPSEWNLHEWTMTICLGEDVAHLRAKPQMPFFNLLFWAKKIFFIEPCEMWTTKHEPLSFFLTEILV